MESIEKLRELAAPPPGCSQAAGASRAPSSSTVSPVQTSCRRCRMLCARLED